MKLPKSKVAASEPPVRLQSLFLCDLVRIEEGGKKMLIGCYQQEIRLKRKPMVFTGRVVGGFIIAPGYAAPIEFMIDSPTMSGQGKLLPPKGAGESESGGYGSFEAGFRALITEPCELLFKWRADGGEWSFPSVWPVVFAEDARELSPAEAKRVIDNYWASTKDSGKLDSLPKAPSKSKKQPRTAH